MCVFGNQYRSIASLIEPDERDSDGEPLLPRVGHGLAHRHHHLPRLRPVRLPVLLQEPAQRILLVRQICLGKVQSDTGLQVDPSERQKPSVDLDLEGSVILPGFQHSDGSPCTWLIQYNKLTA